MSTKTFNFNWPIQKFPPQEGRWKGMTFDAKRQWLIDSGQARDWGAATELLVEHGKAVKAYRAMKKQREEARGK